ncbi:unnamed protein product [Rotaria sp. Silwood1]|nr:unnamed protein product [Rotaria sp. Silwood1]CAF1315471.1 unnamed protein product [Rotaria sp. Silwood1]CAF4650205.1 unnamed protein product [Rotaria sp. Silwood1]
MNNIEILDNIVIYLHRYITWILFLLGNIGNILTGVIFFKKSWKKNVCVFYFLNCLLVNFAYINTTMVGSSFTFGFQIHSESSNVVLCKILYYVSYLLSVLLPNILILASIDRLLISSKNIDTRLYSSKRLAYFSISVSTIFWIIFYIHVLIKIDVQKIYPSGFVCYYDTSGFYFEFISYSTLIIAVGLAFVLIILSILAFKNVRQLQTIPRQQRNQFRIMHKKDFQLLCCLYIHDIVYIIFNVFVAIYYVYVATTKHHIRTPFHQTIDNFLSGFGTFIHHIPYCASFFIFISVSKAFRQEIKRLFYKMCCKDKMSIREAENRQQNIVRNNIELNVVDGIVSTIMLPT